MITVGQHVRINITEPEHWNLSMFRRLQGTTGVVQSIKTHEATGYVLPDPYVCVFLDFEVAGPFGRPIYFHHFGASELVAIDHG